MSDDRQKENRNVRVQAMVTPELAEKLDELAGRLRLSRSEFAAALIEAAIRDEGWIIKLVTSEFMEPARALVKWIQNRKGKGGQAK